MKLYPIYMCVYVYVYVCVCVYIYIHTHTHSIKYTQGGKDRTHRASSWSDLVSIRQLNKFQCKLLLSQHYLEMDSSSAKLFPSPGTDPSAHTSSSFSEP